MLKTVPHTSDLIGIYRMHHRTRGYYLRVMIVRNKKKFQKSFFESRCGGEQGTLTLAQAWRDTICAQHPAIPLAQFCSIVRSNSASGVPGVRRHTKRHRCKDGRVSEHGFWMVDIPIDNGKSRKRSFAVTKYGEEQARQLALDHRMRALEELGSLAYKEQHQPEMVSTEQDKILLEKTLRAPAERRQQRAAEHQTRKQDKALRAEKKLALAQTAELQALNTTTNRSGEPYIGRFTNSSPHWRVGIVRQGELHRKTFTDSIYGGTDQALLAAKAWRDHLFQSLPVESMAQRMTRISATNTSGVAGVGLRTEKKNGDTQQFWVAYGPKLKGYSRRSKAFSVDKYGEKQAFALAVKAREAFVAEFNDAEHLHHRAAKQMKAAVKA